MRVLIINTDYPDFLSWLYSRQPGLENASYDDQMRARNDSLFGVADFYSRNLRTLGHEACDVHANNEFMQRAWARENGIAAGSGLAASEIRSFIASTRTLTAKTPLRHLKPFFRPLVRRLNGQSALLTTLAAQIQGFRPDVILNQAMGEIPDEFIAALKDDARLMVAQVASPLNLQKRFHGYDLVISSLPNFIDHFQRQGIPAELNRFAFEPSILKQFPATRRDIGISFVGSLSEDHVSRLRLLQAIARNTELQIWGQGAAAFSAESPIRLRHHGPLWGVEMYDVLNRSRLTLNHHIGIAENYANNMRLFEATGMGTLLVTDRKDNLAEMFVPQREVAVYSSPEECSEIIRYYLEHEAERDAIARAGQQRTIRDHNYELRMRELADILERCLRSTGRKTARIPT